MSVLDLKFEWNLIRLMTTSIFYDVMNLRDKLPVLDPERNDLRFHISKIGSFAVREAKKRGDMVL